MTSRDVLKRNIMRQLPKQRNSVPNQYGDASNYETLNEPRLKKPLNGHATVDVNVSNASSVKQRNDFRGFT